MAPSTAALRAMMSGRASQLSAQLEASPGLQAVLQDPSRLQQALEDDPALRGVLNASPELAALLTPERLGRALALARGGK